MGDRLKDIPLLLYSAIATDRFFLILHDKPIDMGTFFKINSHWYNSSNEFMSALVDGAASMSPSFNNEYKNAFFGVPPELRLLLEGKSETEQLVAILGGSFQSVQDVFPNISQPLSTIFPELIQWQQKREYSNIDYEVFLSAAYRSTLGRPQEMFQNLADEFVDSLNLGKKSLQSFVKIGVHIRLSFGEQKGIKPKQIKCYISQVLTIINNCDICKTKKVLIFVASNSNLTAKKVARGLKGVAKVVDAESIRQKYNSSLNHLDQAIFPTNGGQRWIEASSTYLDWYILSHFMDLLVITTSGFSETAALYSLVPTFEFNRHVKGTCSFRIFSGDPSQVFQEKNNL